MNHCADCCSTSHDQSWIPCLFRSSWIGALRFERHHSIAMEIPYPDQIIDGTSSNGHPATERWHTASEATPPSSL